MTTVLGLDIGGGEPEGGDAGQARAVFPFALWKHPENCPPRSTSWSAGSLMWASWP